MVIQGLETIDYEKRAKDSDYKKRLNKVMTEKEAVGTFLHDGNSFCMGGFVMWRQPQSIMREIARQGKKNLSIIDESGDFEGIDLLVELGMLDRIDIAYSLTRQVGGISGTPALERGLKEGIPRPVEAGGVMATPKEKIESGVPPVKIVDWTNFEISLRLMAGALNVPFMPCRSSLGADIPKYTKDIKVIDDPYENKPLLLVPAYKPDVAFISVQRADRRGNGQIWGFRGTDYWKARAAKHVVLITEELVPTEKIYENPGLTTIPAYCTDAVVHLPFNCLPTGCYGYYIGDLLCFVSLLLQRQSRDGALEWIDEWVYGLKDHFEYCNKLGWEKIDRLAKSEHKLNRIPG
ncbi:MAG: CoA transferase subunit A [Dehalococcoidales bacterium]|nr:MAG: CoA transferase subunit A [Dehalococcoidales bacterium]